MHVVRLCVQSALEVYKEILLLYLEEGRRQVNTRCAHLEPWQIIVATFITTLGALWVKGFLFQRESNLSHAKHGSKVGLLECCSAITRVMKQPSAAKVLHVM